MSEWQTISVKRLDGSTDTYSRFVSHEKNPKIEQFLIGSKGCCFDGETFWLSHDVGDAYIVTAHDTANSIHVEHVFGDESCGITSAPDWVEIGGNWK